MSKTCHICNAEMVQRQTSLQTGWGAYKISVEGIQAYVCPICGEVILEGKEALMLQKLSRSLSESAMTEKPDPLNLSEVAALLRVSNQTIYNMIRDGRLKAQKIGREWRFSREEIMAILAGEEARRVQK